MKKRHLYVI